METPKEPWGFCETPEEKCTMNYCDDNGCQNRKRVLVYEPQKLETLYRKVSISERLPERDGNFNTDVGTIYLLKKTWQPSEFLRKAKVNEYHEDYFEEPEYWFEEIPNNTQIKKLEAEKAELLEALEEINSKLNNMHLTDDRLTAIYNTNRSLIQKMKQ